MNEMEKKIAREFKDACMELLSLALKTLREVEWIYDNIRLDKFCPTCDDIQDFGDDEHHEDDCSLGNTIKQLEEAVE